MFIAQDFRRDFSTLWVRIVGAVLRALVAVVDWFNEDACFRCLLVMWVVAFSFGVLAANLYWWTGRASMDDYAHGLQYRFWRNEEPVKH